ncbi:MAG: hypothetical protein Cons2KO_11890 [Congregibacter sp.]
MNWKRTFRKSTLALPGLLGITLCAVSTLSFAQPRGILALDSDGDGRVSREEFRLPERSKTSRLFERGDANGDGNLTRDELLSTLDEGAKERSEAFREGALEGFDALDANGDGVLQRDEAREQAFLRADQNADGFVSDEEARALRDERKQRRRDRANR